MRWLVDLATPLPVYVTRPTADGVTGSYSISAWIPLLIGLLMTLNLILWGLVGITEAVRLIG